MKLLLLGGSSESGRDAGGSRRHQLLESLLTEEFGQPVEVVPKQMWPTQRLPAYVERCITESNPDLIYMLVNEFAINYPSTPVRLQRFGPAGRWLANRSLRFADTPAAHNRAVRTVRRVLQATIGGDPHIPADEGIATFVEAVRVAARHEEAFLMVKGPFGWVPGGVTRRQRAKADAIRLRLHRALRDTCATLHIPYDCTEVPAWSNPQDPYYGAADQMDGDGVHINSTLGAERSARRHFNDIRAMYRAHHPPPGQ